MKFVHNLQKFNSIKNSLNYVKTKQYFNLNENESF